MFTEKIHDFGSVNEGGGNVSTEFTFINKSGRPVKILNVQPSCGCTTPDWTREAIDDGKTGVIKANFDPRGKVGYFNKAITVTSDYGAPITLAIKGNVVGGSQESKDESFKVANGSLRTKVSTFNIGKIFINKENGPKTFEILNGGKRDLMFGEVHAPAYIQIQTPEKLKAGEQGVIKLLYNVKLKNTYGFTSDNIELVTNDTESPVKAFSVFATIEEYFPPLTNEALESAPILKIENRDMKFPEMLESTTLEREVIIQNPGTKELSIRALQPNCKCLTATANSYSIRPGQSATIKISFSPKGRPGRR